MNWSEPIKNKLLRSSIVEGLYYSIPPNLLFGNDYTKMTSHLDISEFWNKEAISTYQFNKTKDLLTLAFNFVPYYRKLFDSKSFNPSTSFNELSDIKKVPTLDRADVINNQIELINVAYPKHRLFFGSTSGSSGIPLSFYRDIKLDMALETAFRHHMFKRIGYANGQKEVVLRGHTIADSKDNVFWRKQGAKRLLLSSYHIKEENIKYYIDILSKFNPQYVWAYPSSAHLLSKLLASEDHKFDKVKGIILASENIYDWQVIDIQRSFPSAKVIGFYGNSERNVIASWCEHTHEYHFEPLYGYTELLDQDGNDVTKEGEIGEIVVTGFLNRAFPFIRYKTGDLASLSSSPCECNRKHMRVKEIMGRSNERLMTSDGRLIPIPTISIHNDTFRNVIEFQFIQNNKNEIDLNIVKSSIYSIKDEQQIVSELKKKIGFQTTINIKYIKGIKRSARGKHKTLIQNIPYLTIN